MALTPPRDAFATYDTIATKRHCVSAAAQSKKIGVILPKVQVEA